MTRSLGYDDGFHYDIPVAKSLSAVDFFGSAELLTALNSKGLRRPNYCRATQRAMNYSLP